MLGQLGYRLIDQHLSLRTGAIRAEQRDKGLLASGGILAQRLAGRRFIAFVIEQIISDLEGQTNIAGIAAQLPPALGRNPAKDRPHLHRRTQQSAGFQLLQPGDRRQVKSLILGDDIHHLAARHAVHARCRAQRQHQFGAGEGIGDHFRIGENLKRQRV